MFGLNWGAPATAVTERFAGLAAEQDAVDMLSWPLGAVVDRMVQEGAFVPSAMLLGDDRVEDRLTAQFVAGGLAAMTASFGFPFEAIRQDPDRLSEQGMALIARAEFAQMFHQIAARYGAPIWVQESAFRLGKLYGVANAHFVRPDGTAVQVLFGHHITALAGSLRYLAPIEDARGF